MTLRTIIVEDERLARLELKTLLKNLKDVEIIGEAANIEIAEKLIRQERPDLILLDISMPGGDGFSLLEKLDYIPQVIFTTAYDQFAIKAFEVNAVDYLLKPISEQRLEQAIQKALKVKSQEKNDHQNIFIKEGEQCWLVKVNDIELMESIGNYTRLYFRDQKPMVKRSLNALLQQLPQSFIRVSRSHILNLDKIRAIDTGINGGLEIAMPCGETVIPSRRQEKALKEKWMVW